MGNEKAQIVSPVSIEIRRKLRDTTMTIASILEEYRGTEQEREANKWACSERTG